MKLKTYFWDVYELVWQSSETIITIRKSAVIMAEGVHSLVSLLTFLIIILRLEELHRTRLHVLNNKFEVNLMFSEYCSLIYFQIS